MNWIETEFLLFLTGFPLILNKQSTKYDFADRSPILTDTRQNQNDPLI